MGPVFQPPPPLLVNVVISQVVVIPDANLEVQIRAALPKPSGALRNLDLLALSQLSADNAGVANLSGLEWASNLTKISLSGNFVSTIAPLQGLSGLGSLTIDNNPLGESRFPVAGADEPGEFVDERAVAYRPFLCYGTLFIERSERNQQPDNRHFPNCFVDECGGCAFEP